MSMAKIKRGARFVAMVWVSMIAVDFARKKFGMAKIEMQAKNALGIGPVEKEDEGFFSMF